MKYQHPIQNHRRKANDYAQEHAVSIAHGYAKVTGKPMAVGLHANVGLMHASMGIFNAFTDRVPMLILGATGPLDATRRRPWIDWLHTATDQAALVRGFIKFDDQPQSPNAAIKSLIQATAMTASKPCAPVYVCLDLALQEDAVNPETLHFPDTKRYLDVHAPGPSQREAAEALALLDAAQRPVFMFGRTNRSKESWLKRVQLAERYGAKVITDLKQACSFPTNHPLHGAAPSIFNPPEACEVIRSSDTILSFDWVDLAGALVTAYGAGAEPKAKIVNISLDSALHNGWSKDHFDIPPADIQIRADSDEMVNALLEAGKASKSASREQQPTDSKTVDPPMNGTPEGTAGRNIFMTDLAHALYSTISPEDLCLVRVPLGFKGADLRAEHPLAFMGMDGGAGIGSGPGQVVGTALAMRDMSSPLMPVAILGDGDFCMGSSALWTAARYRLPLLVIIANNGSYFNDEVHQERVAKHRSRPVENKWIGMRLDDPAPDIHKIAEGLGCTTLSSQQINSVDELQSVLRKAVQAVKEGKPVVVDVQVLPEGYASALEKAR
jgi:thiamine pyrophosphate-dependent acetolactate synthase large subunit-like protein